MPAALTSSTASSSQLQVLAATVVVPAAEADADSDTMQSILSVLPEAVRAAVMEHSQSRQAAALSQGLILLLYFFHGLHLQMWRMSYHDLQMWSVVPLHIWLQSRALLHNCTHGLVQMFYISLNEKAAHTFGYIATCHLPFCLNDCL